MSNGGVLAAGAFFIGVAFCAITNYDKFTNPLEKSPITPNQLEIKCEYITGNGSCETTATYQGKSCIFEYSGNKLTCVPYNKNK